MEEVIYQSDISSHSKMQVSHPSMRIEGFSWVNENLRVLISQRVLESSHCSMRI